MKLFIFTTQIIKSQNAAFTWTSKSNFSTVVKSKKPLKKVITLDNLNRNIVQMKFAVQGPLFLRAMEIEKELIKGVSKPFKKVIKMHTGDSHATGQMPMTFIRQVLACVSYPELIRKRDFPCDVNDRATHILSGCMGNSIGSYSSDIGYEIVRRSVAEFIERRDGFKANSDNIYLAPGASVAIKGCLQLLVNNINGKPSGVMVPIPQNPFYSASLTEFGLRQINYYLDEHKNWHLTTKELERSFEEGSKTCKIRALVVINPGNPSGQVMTRTEIETMIKFAQKKSLFIFADEVYQQNIYKSKFHSVKKILMELGNPYNQSELVSFMSASYGHTGEGGIRGGWMEIVNMDPDVQYNLFKCISARLCPSTLGQTVIECIARPPVKGEPSYDLYYKEKSNVILSLYDKATKIEDIFNKLKGFSCNTIQGGLYAFPRIVMPPKAIIAAKQAGQTPDEFYAFKLLEEAGICVIPGSAFGQKSDSYHFRTTILPQPELMTEIGDKLRSFQEKFIKEFS